MAALCTVSESTITPTSEPIKAQERCAICNETMGTLRHDGQTETPYALPCSHIFGSICIIRWLQIDSRNQDCPYCRRPMAYRRCGHLIMPCDASKSPPTVEEEDMPENCASCQGEDSHPIIELLRLRLRRLEAEERALRGVEMHWPSLFCRMYKNPAESVGERMRELRREYTVEAEALWRHYEEMEGRSQW